MSPFSQSPRILLLLIAVLGSVSVSCGSHDPVGRWVEYNVGSQGYPVSMTDNELELFEDKTCTMGPRSGRRFGCEWVQLSDGRTKLEATAMGTTMVFVGRFGAEMGTLQAPDGEEGSLVRVGSGEEERIRKRVEAEQLNVLAIDLKRKGDLEEAYEKLKEAYKLGSAMAATNLCGWRLEGFFVESDLEAALDLCREAIDRGDSDARVRLGLVYERLGRYSDALETWREAAEEGSLRSRNNIAWMLATCADPDLRNGEEAVALASAVVGEEEGRWKFWGTLAAAHARQGDYNAAVDAQRRSLRLMRTEDVPDATRREAEETLFLYESGQPVVWACTDSKKIAETYARLSTLLEEQGLELGEEGEAVFEVYVGEDADPNRPIGTQMVSRTPLEIAAHSGLEEVTRSLLRRGAAPDLRTRAGWPPLYAASLKRETTIVELLLDHGADPNLDKGDGWTPLHAAVGGHEPIDLELVALLLRHGADPSAQSPEGDTVIDVARRMDHPDLLELLEGGLDRRD